MKQRISLEEIYLKYGIRLRNERGFLRNAIDVLEDIYMRCSAKELAEIREEIWYEEQMQFVFDEERKKGDWTL